MAQTPAPQLLSTFQIHRLAPPIETHHPSLAPAEQSLLHSNFPASTPPPAVLPSPARSAHSPATAPPHSSNASRPQKSCTPQSPYRPPASSPDRCPHSIAPTRHSPLHPKKTPTVKNADSAASQEESNQYTFPSVFPPSP